MALTHFVKRIVQRRAAILRIDFSQWQTMTLPVLALIRNWSTLPSVNTKTKKDFEKLVTRLTLTDNELAQRQQWFKLLTSMWLSFFGLTLFYGVYLAIAGAWLSVVSIIVLGTMMLSQAFQYHFWSFQIMRRRCGCSLKEWSLFAFGKW